MRVGGTVTIDSTGTFGALHASGKVRGTVRYQGHRALVSGRSRGGEPTPAVVSVDLSVWLPPETLPPLR